MDRPIDMTVIAVDLSQKSQVALALKAVTPQAAVQSFLQSKSKGERETLRVLAVLSGKHTAVGVQAVTEGQLREYRDLISRTGGAPLGIGDGEGAGRRAPDRVWQVFSLLYYAQAGERGVGEMRVYPLAASSAQMALISVQNRIGPPEVGLAVSAVEGDEERVRILLDRNTMSHQMLMVA